MFSRNIYPLWFFLCLPLFLSVPFFAGCPGETSESDAGDGEEGGDGDADAGLADAGDGDGDADAGLADAGDGDGDGDAGMVGDAGGDGDGDAGEVHADAGNLPSDAGEGDVDAGSGAMDSGVEPPDAGSTEMDAGPFVDGGTVVMDDGGSPSDAGAPSDAGSAVQDGGPASGGLGQVEQMGTCNVPGAAEPGTNCYRLAVTCPGVDVREVELLVTPPAATFTEARGTVVLGSGGEGTSFYSPDMMPVLANLGFRVINRQWNETWEGSDTAAGVATAACRYTSLMAWIRSRPWSTGPLCATGNSGGSAEIAYFLAHWKGTEILDVAVLSGGPPMSRIDWGCLEPAEWIDVCTEPVPPEICGGEPQCPYNAGNKSLFDAAFGNMACTNQDPAAAAFMHEQSILGPTAVLTYPQTPIHFVQGKEDCSNAMAQGFLYVDAVTSEKTVEYAEAPHQVFSTADGAQRIADALEEKCICRHGTCEPFIWQ